MTGRHLQRSAGLCRPRPHFIEQILLRLLFGLDSSVLKRAYQKMRLRRPAGLKERKHICPTISDMHDRGLGRKASQARDQAHPHIRFPFASLSLLAARLSHWGWRAHKRLLERTAQHLAAFRQDSEHRLDIQPSPSLIANLAQTR